MWTQPGNNTGDDGSPTTVGGGGGAGTCQDGFNEGDDDDDDDEDTWLQERVVVKTGKWLGLCNGIQWDDHEMWNCVGTLKYEPEEE